MKVALLLLALVGWLSGVRGHGRLMDPPARNSMWRLGFNNPVNYNDNELFCGGRMVQWLRNGGKCGVCGDSWHGNHDHEAGGKYANGITTRQYVEGDEIPITVHLTANHQGYFEFRICPVNDKKVKATQACLDKHVLQRPGGQGSKFPVPRGKYNAFFNYSLLLPPGLTCSQCVVQWKYRTGNTWDKDTKSGAFCLGCGPQEEFYNCADVVILPRDGKAPKSTQNEALPKTVSAIVITPTLSPPMKTTKATISKKTTTTTTKTSSPTTSTKDKEEEPALKNNFLKELAHSGKEAEEETQRRHREEDRRLREREDVLGFPRYQGKSRDTDEERVRHMEQRRRYLRTRNRNKPVEVKYQWRAASPDDWSSNSIWDGFKSSTQPRPSTLRATSATAPEAPAKGTRSWLVQSSQRARQREQQKQSAIPKCIPETPEEQQSRLEAEASPTPRYRDNRLRQQQRHPYRQDGQGQGRPSRRHSASPYAHLAPKDYYDAPPRGITSYRRSSSRSLSRSNLADHVGRDVTGGEATAVPRATMTRQTLSPAAVNTVWWSRRQTPSRQFARSDRSHLTNLAQPDPEPSYPEISPSWRRSTRPSLICRGTVTLGGGMDAWCTANCNARFCPGAMCTCRSNRPVYRKYHAPRAAPLAAATRALAPSSQRLRSTDSRYFGRATFDSISPYDPPSQFRSVNPYIPSISYTRAALTKPQAFDRDDRSGAGSGFNGQSARKNPFSPRQSSSQHGGYGSQSDGARPVQEAPSRKEVAPKRQGSARRPKAKKEGVYSCRAIGQYSGQPQFDDWCQRHCLNVICPLLICKCTTS